MSSTNMIRVLLVDDHPIMRRGLRDVLEDSGVFEVVGLAADGVEAVRKAEETRPDVIVMDMMMPKEGWRGGLSRNTGPAAGCEGADAHGLQRRRML